MNNNHEYRVSQKIDRVMQCLDLNVRQKFVLTLDNVTEINNFLEEVKQQAQENEHTIINLSKRNKSHH